jgi:hypothetical protein
MIKKALTAAAIALTLGGAAVATATPAAAQGWHGGYYHGGWHRGGWGPGAAVGAGILGLAVGASLASPHYYAPAPYYGPAYGYGYGPCYSHVRWDPYLGHYVRVGGCY